MTEKITYYISSTVLGGQVVTELSEQGAKERTSVFAGGSELASQSITSGTQSVQWQHYDASGASYRGTDSTGQWNAAKELDPLGANAGLMKPITWNVPDKKGLPVPHPLIADMLEYPGGGCTLDRMPIPCEIRNNLMNAGNVVNETLINRGRGWEVFRDAVKPRGVGLFTTFTYSVDRYGEPRARGIVITVPQNSRAVPLQSPESLRQEFKKLLSDPDCKEFVEGVIREAESRVAESLRLNMGFEDLFENIAHQGGYVLQDNLNLNGYAISGAVERAKTSIAQGNAQVLIRTRHYYTTDKPRIVAERFAAQRRNYLASAFHETFHHIGRISAAFSDEALGRAAFKLTGDTTGLPSGSDVLEWSSYFDNQLMRKCMPDMVRRGEPGAIK